MEPGMIAVIINGLQHIKINSLPKTILKTIPDIAV